MASLTFADAGFSVVTPDGSDENSLVVEEISGSGGFRLFNEDGSCIADLDLKSYGKGMDLTVDGSVKGVNTSLYGGDTVIFEGKVTKSDFSTDGDSVLRFRGNDVENVSRGNNFDLGTGDDKLIFGGAVLNTTITDAGGKDTIRFRGDITNTEINLSSNSQSTIKLSEDAAFEGFKINGADDNDILLIGSSQYSYQSDQQEWVNIDDQSDTKSF